MLLRICLFILFAGFNVSNLSHAQESQRIQNLKNEIANSVDTVKVLRLLDLAQEFKKINLDSMKQFVDSAEGLSKLIGFEKGKYLSVQAKTSYLYNSGDFINAEKVALESIRMIEKYGYESDFGNMYNLLGLIRMNLGMYPLSESNYKTALSYYLRDSDEDGQAKVFHNLGVVSFFQNDYEKSTKYYFDALHLAERVNDKSLLAQVNTNLGSLFTAQEDFEKAIIYLRRALLLYNDLTDNRGIAKTYSGLGTTFFNYGNLDSSLVNHLKALNLYVELGNSSGEAEVLNNIGEIYLEKQDYVKALTYIEKSDSIRVRKGEKYGQAICTHNLGRVYHGLNDLKTAEKYYSSAIEKAKEINATWLLIQIYGSRSALYEDVNNHKAALNDWKLKTTISDSLFNLEKSQAILDLEQRYKAEKKDVELELRKNRINYLEKERETFTILVISGLAIALLLVFLIYTYYSREKIKQADKLELASKNLEISKMDKQLEESLRQAAEKSLKIARIENEQIHAELEFKKRELGQMALLINQKNEILESIKGNITNNTSYDSRRLEREIEQRLNISKQREDFEMNVDLINEDFYFRLKSKHPEITEKDKKLCAMIRLGLTSKEIASIIGISPKSVDMNRYRLRKKLDLAGDLDLSKYLTNV